MNLSPASAEPLVSVIIPTIRRPALVRRAVMGVLAQTHRNLDIIVIIDGPDPETAAALAGFDDPRLRVIQNSAALGAGGARNAAARAACGHWLAFLDDDDEWLPQKLERQLAAVAGDDRPVLVTCRCHVRTPRGDFIWPRRVYDPAEAVDDYLFGRRSFMRGEAYLATPTFLLPKDLFDRSGGFGATRQEEDTTLLLRVTKSCGGRILMVSDPLVVIHENPSDSLGSHFAWRESLAWLDSMGPKITRRAYSGFCLVTLASQAAREADYAAIPFLLRRAFGRGSPGLVQLLLFAAFWAVPAGLRQRLRAALTGAPAGAGG